MDRLLDYLASHWFALSLVAVALLFSVPIGILLLTRRQKRWPLGLIASAAAFLAAGLGGLILDASVGMWVVGGAAAALAVLFIWLVLTGQWSAAAAWALAAALFFGAGGWAAPSAGAALEGFGRLVRSLEVLRPGWLVLLVLIPIIIGMSFRSLGGLGPVRRWLAMGLRCALIFFLTLALADVRLKQPNDSVTVLFLVDVSLSVPPEHDPNDKPPPGKSPVDLRWERIKRFVNEAVEKRGPAHKRDQAGLIVFGRRPSLELPPSDAPRFSSDPRIVVDGRRYPFLDEVVSGVDSHYTDIAAAIKLALASFPEGTGKRIVLITDGNENLGNALEQARIARHNGIEIDVVPLASGFRPEDEVMVERVEAPSRTERGSRPTIKVHIRNFNPYPVAGTLTLRQIADGRPQLLMSKPLAEPLRPGANTIFIPLAEALPEGSYTYEAVFEPEGVLVPGRARPRPLAGDRVQNNQATTHVIALGQRRILVVEPKEGDHAHLVDTLRGIGKSKFRVGAIAAEALPKEKDKLGVFLSNFDCVILANVPSELVSKDQQEVLRSNTYDQGCGLIMIGGPESYGAGGWQGTPVEKALPVDCDIKAIKVQGKGGLVLLMHASEMADGNRWQKEIAKLAIDKLGPVDMLGVIHYDFNGTVWHVPFRTVGEQKLAMKRLVDKMNPGDMPEFDTALQLAYNELSNAKYQLAKRHMIIISDGDPQQSNNAIVGQMAAAGITVSTVGVATHGAPEKQRMDGIAKATGGKFYNVSNPALLPQIYTKEARVVSQSFVFDQPFTPTLMDRSGPTQQMPENLRPLHGFVRTTAKPAVTVNVPILGPPQGDQQFPILAHWQYGLGKSVAFTSDARSGPDKLGWDQDWAKSDIYLRFWEQVVDFSVRAVETGRLLMDVEHKDGKVIVTVEARDRNGDPLSDLTVRGGVTSPNPKAEEQAKYELKLEPVGVGLYRAEFKADEAGSYFVNVRSQRRVADAKGVEKEEIDSVRAGVTIPYSPEFEAMGANLPLLNGVRELTQGRAYDEVKSQDKDTPDLEQAAESGELFRLGLPQAKSMQQIWFWLVVTTAVLLFFDVAVRRIAVNPAEVSALAGKLWNRLRNRPVTESLTIQFLDRLKSRKAQVDEELEKARAATRFEGGDIPAAAPPPGADSAAPPPLPSRKPATTPGLAPTSAAEPEDYATRLMRAKKKAMEERDKK